MKSFMNDPQDLNNSDYGMQQAKYNVETGFAMVGLTSDFEVRGYSKITLHN